MKQWLSLCLSLVLVLGCALSVSAVGEDDFSQVEEQVIDLTEFTGEVVADDPESEFVPNSESDPELSDGVSSVSGGNDLSELDISDLTINADNVMLASVPENNDYPSGAPLSGGVYIEAVTSQLGSIIIYVPVSYQYKSFTTNTDGDPINITSSTITGYTYTGDDYYIRWNSFGQAQYRLVDYDYGTNFQNLDITSIVNTNVVFIEGAGDLPVVPDSDMLLVIVIFLVGGCLLCLFMRRL